MLCNVVATTADLPPQAVITSDGEPVLVEVVILWEIFSPIRFLLQVEDAVSVLSEAGAGTVHDVVSGMTWKEVQAASADQTLKESIRHRATRWGVNVMNVQITSLSRLGLKHGSIRISQPSQFATT